MKTSESPIGRSTIIPLWDAEPPNYKSSLLHEYKEFYGDIELIRNIIIPTIEIRIPSKRDSILPAVIICPGGGYEGIAYHWEGTNTAKLLNDHGIAAIILKYRLPTPESNHVPHLSPLLDAERAIRLVRHNSSEWGIDPNKIGIMGFSAGGHLASTLGTHYSEDGIDSTDPIDRLSSRPDFMSLIYPVISMQDETTHAGSKSNLLTNYPSPDLVRYYSNEQHVNARTPRCFLLHSADDAGVPISNSLLFYSALIDHSVAVEMHLYPYGGHGYSLALEKGRLANWTSVFIDWLKSAD